MHGWFTRARFTRCGRFGGVKVGYVYVILHTFIYTITTQTQFVSKREQAIEEHVAIYSLRV